MTFGSILAAVIGYGASLLCLGMAVAGLCYGPAKMEMTWRDLYTGAAILVVASFGFAVITSAITGI